MISIKNLNIKYDRVLLENVSFKASKGNVHLIAGKSGTGKTSLLYRIGLLAQQDDYEYYFNGEWIDFNEKDVYRNSITFVLQNGLIKDEYTVKQNIEFFLDVCGKCYDQKEINHLFKEFNLNIALNQLASTLSGGERQRLSIVCALLKDSEIIIFDEPTASLDKKNEKEAFEMIYKLAHEKNKCVIMSTHSKVAREYSDIVYEIKEKQLICLNEKENDKKITKREFDLSDKILLTYVKNHLSLFRRRSLTILGIITGMFLSILGFNYYSDQQEKESVKLIESLSDNQVFISSKNHHIYVDDELFDTSLLDNMDFKGNMYPYISSFFYLGSQKVDILPLYEENDILDKYAYKYNILDDQGVILSGELYDYMMLNHYSIRSFHQSIVIDGNLVDYDCNVRGVFKEGVLNHYTKNDYYIYIDHKILESNSHQNKYYGYTLFGESIDEYNRLIRRLESMNVDINKEFANVEAIESLSINTEKMKSLFTVSMTIILYISIVYLVVHHFSLRKNEFVINIVSGYTIYHIKRLIVYEILFYIATPSIPILLIAIPFGMIMKYSILWFIVYVLVSLILLGILSYGMCCYDMKKISVETILRS